MKALILEAENGQVIALRENGEVVSARADWAVGETVELPEAAPRDKVLRLPVKKRRWAQAVIAASLALVVLTGSYTYTTAWACSYVSLETEEASVELAVNRLGQVIEVKPLNENSAQLAQTLTADLRSKPVGEAVDLAVERFQADGWVRSDEAVLAGVTDSDRQRAADLTEEIEQLAETRRELQTVEVTPRQREQALDQQMGGGRYVREQEETQPQPAGQEEPPQEQQAEAPENADPGEPIRQEAPTESVPAPGPENRAQPPESTSEPEPPAFSEDGQAAPERPDQEPTQPEAPANPEAQPRQPDDSPRERQGEPQPGDAGPGPAQQPGGERG